MLALAREPGQILVLEKAFQILALFTPEAPELEMRTIREGSGLPPTTCTRIVRSLLASGLLSEREGRYRVGPTALRLADAALAGLDVLDVIRPLLVELRDETAETAGFFVREGASRVCVAFAESREPIGRRLSLGHTLPLDVGSPGKVLLAFDPEALPALREESGSRAGDAGLAEAVARVRRDGYALSKGEWSPEVGGIAAPVFAADGTPAGALALSAPLSRLPAARIEELSGRLLQAAAKAEAALQMRASA